MAKIIFCKTTHGNPDVGKTSLVNKYVLNRFSEYQATIGPVFYSKNIYYKRNKIKCIIK